MKSVNPHFQHIDRVPQEAMWTILINQSHSPLGDVSHNKFWMIRNDANDSKTILVKYGRIGTDGQEKSKSFPTQHEADTFQDKKILEKVRKAYREADENELKLLNAQAAIIGTNNKCLGAEFVELVGERYEKVDSLRLADPNCKAAMLIKIETRKPIRGRTYFRLLFTCDDIYDGEQGVLEPLKDGHPLYEFAEKAGKVIGTML